ncbi:MAG TPA: carbohydrate ABC transporter permease [Spirochaetia bacterium]|nr:carbohydrate ABC transporter permease [Spirochaetia bacterium]
MGRYAMKGEVKRKRLRLSDVLSFFTLCLVVFVLGIPFLWAVSNALKTEVQANLFPPILFAWPPAWNNFYVALVKLLPFHIFFRNTLVIAASVIAGELLSSSFVAYGFAKLKFPGREALFAGLLSTMMLPYVVRMIPLFILYTRLGWINTFYPLIVPHFFAGTPLYVFLLRQFYKTIPDELSDASRIDGSSELQIWWHIMLPLTRPALAALTILAFQTVWNDFMEPLVILRDTSVKTVMLGIYSLIGMEPEWTFVMAAVIAVMVPTIVLFFIFQRFFVEGITVTGMKA